MSELATQINNTKNRVHIDFNSRWSCGPHGI